MSSSPSLLIATRNAHKTEEIAAMLGDRFEVRDLRSLSEAPDIEESGETFLANATLKAVGISAVFEGLVLADDSGLEVDALDGAPGVHSARYAGAHGDDAGNNAKLLTDLSEVEGAARSARFRCVMVIAEKGKALADFSGAVEGCLRRESEGEGGFGYDPLFVPEGHARSFASLPPEVKNGMSHRARALAQAIAWFEGRSACGRAIKLG